MYRSSSESNSGWWKHVYMFLRGFKMFSRHSGNCAVWSEEEVTQYINDSTVLVWLRAYDIFALRRSE